MLSTRRIPQCRKTGQRPFTTHVLIRPRAFSSLQQRQEMLSRIPSRPATAAAAPGQIRPQLSRPRPRPTNPQKRPFTNTQTQHIVSHRNQIRPQLPFLSTTTTRPSPWSSTHLRQHFTRLISTESRDYYRRRISRGLRIGLSFYAILVLVQVVRLGLYQEGIEQRWPTPDEWSWKCRWCLRSATALMHPEDIGKLMTNWPMVAGYLRELLEILEADGDIVVDDMTGTVDVEGKSEAWRKGYFQALLGAAKAAENLDGWFTDRRQKISAPREYVVGPSNPRPTPMPAGQTKVPLEEDCEPASDSPATFYMKILTTRGFDADQKVGAALAYADWLGYMGLSETEFDMYQWALDIAAAGTVGVAVDRRGVLSGKGHSSENILRVSTALGVHHVKRGDLSTALSVFTSVLRARDSISQSNTNTNTNTLPTGTNTIPTTQTGPISPTTTLKNMISGGVPGPVDTPGENPCATAALKTYIGEIIYATSSREAGLAWTRDAVDSAESTALSSDAKTRAECTDCLRVALQNWKVMLDQLIARADQSGSGSGSGSGWFGLGKKDNEKERWEAERAVLEEKVRRVVFYDGVGDGLGSGLEGGLGGNSLFV